MPATPAWLASIEAVFNRGIEGSSAAGVLARRLNASAMRLQIEGVTCVRASVSGRRLALIVVSGAADLEAAADEDAVISGSPFALLALARDFNRTIKGGSVHIRGNAEIANGYRQLFALARPDFEEELSRIVGDFPAQRLARLARQMMAWARHAQRTAGENVAEYLKEESRDLVTRWELEEFKQGVDRLRETVDRIEARLARLEQRPEGSR